MRKDGNKKNQVMFINHKAVNKEQLTIISKRSSFPKIKKKITQMLKGKKFK